MVAPETPDPGGDLFATLVGDEVKNAMRPRHVTAKALFEITGHAESSFSGWLSGKSQLPLSVLAEVCVIIEAEPGTIVDRAWKRLPPEYKEEKRAPHK